MRFDKKYTFRVLAVIIVPLFILAACASTPTDQPTQPPAFATQTADASGPGSSQPGGNSLLAALTANDVNVTVSDSASGDKVLQKFETANIPLGDRILLDKTGRGVMRFGDRHEVDFFGDTEIQLADAQLEPGGSIFLRLKQARGHTHTQLNPQAIARVTLETADSTMTTLEQGTEFAVCFAPGKVTCIVVMEGALEVTSQGTKQVYKKGEFTFYEPGQQPQPPLCIRQDEIESWLLRKRSQTDAEPLSQLVASWPQEPCAPGSTETVSTPAPPEPLMVCENFDSGFTLGQIIGAHPDWVDAQAGPPVDAGIGVNGSIGLAPGNDVFIWSTQALGWNEPDFQGIIFQMDFQTNEEGKFNDDRVGWTINNADANSDYMFGVQLDPGGIDQNIEAYWDGDILGDDGGRTSITALPALPANTWYRLRAQITKLSAASARIDASLTQLDASGNAGAVIASGSIADTSLLPNTPENEVPNPVYFSSPIWPAYKNFSYAIGAADNACYQALRDATVQPPAETSLPTIPPTAAAPPALSVRINSITVDHNGRYIVEYETFGYTEQLPGMHVHFFFNTVPPEQAGLPGGGPWILYGGPRPFTQYTMYDRPAQATQMCALVANSDHSVQLNTGNCVDLP